MTAPVTHRMSFTADSTPEIEQKIAEFLRKRGYDVTRRTDPQLTIGELARLVDRKTPGVSVSLRRPSCPPYVAIRSGTGRILKIHASERLVSHLKGERP